MLINAFEHIILVRGNSIAGADDLELAKKIAFKIAKREHCDVDVMSAFTGEIEHSLCCYLHITYNANKEEVEKFYEVKERVW